MEKLTATLGTPVLVDEGDSFLQPTVILNKNKETMNDCLSILIAANV
jgi:hypothetical protein